MTFRGHNHSLQRAALGLRVWDCEMRPKSRHEALGICTAPHKGWYTFFLRPETESGLLPILF